MRFEFKLTFEEFREGYVLAAATAERQKTQETATSPWTWPVLTVVVMAAVSIAGWSVRDGWTNIGIDLPALSDHYGHGIEWALVLLIGPAYRYAARCGGQLGKASFVGVLFIAAGLCTAIELFRTNPTPFRQITWISLASLWYAYWRALSSRDNYWRLWASNPTREDQQIMEVSEEGLIISHPFSRHEFSWEALYRWEESQTLFLLFLTNGLETVPKRAIAKPEEIKHFRDLVLTGANRKRGFPVIIPAQAAGAANS